MVGDWNSDGIDSFGLYYPDIGWLRGRNDLDWNSGLYPIDQQLDPASLDDQYQRDHLAAALGRILAGGVICQIIAPLPLHKGMSPHEEAPYDHFC